MIVDYKGRAVLTGLTGLTAEEDRARSRVWTAWAEVRLDGLYERIHGRSILDAMGGVVTCRCGDGWRHAGDGTFVPLFDEREKGRREVVEAIEIASDLRKAAASAATLKCLRSGRCLSPPRVGSCGICDAKWYAREAAANVAREAESLIRAAIETHEGDIEFAEATLLVLGRSP